MWPFTLLASATWGFPILAALHVLGLAWFGGLVLVPQEFPRLKRIGLAFMLLTGLMLFLIQPARYSHSIAFWIKMGCVALAVRRSWLVVWFAVIVAARMMAFI